MTWLRTRIIAGLAATLLVAGCGSSMKLPPNSENAPPPEFSLVTDIPILPGAEMDPVRSLILSDRDRWTGRVVMKVGKSPSEAAALYQAQMPGFGWEPVMSVTSETSVLSFTRGDRAATVQIEKGSLWGATVLVTVAPRQAGGAAAPQPAAYGGRAPVRTEPVR